MGYLRFETPVAVDTSFDDVLDGYEKPEVLNLNRAIQTYAWKRYVKSIRYPRRLVKRKDRHFFRFSWDGLNFKHSTSMKKVEADESILHPLTRQAQKHTNEGNRHSYLSLDIQGPQIINSAQFENRTSQDTSCLFKTDTETKAKFTVDFSEQYSLGEKSNVEVMIPARFVSPTNDTDFRLVATKLHSQRFKETVTWAVDAEIPVKAGHRSNAMLSAQGQQTTVDFEVLTTMTLASHWLPVHIFRKSDKARVFTCFITDLHQVFRRFQGPQLCLTPTCTERNHVTNKVSLISRGQCKMLGWTDVQVFVSSEDIHSRERLVESQGDVVL